MNPSDSEDLDASKEAVLSKLALQMASAVEWTTQIQTMYDAGARAFVEVGPKRALSMFAAQILEDQPHLPVMTNHPKQGGIASFLAALATMALAGRPMHWPASDSPTLTEAFRAGPIEAHRSQPPAQDLKSRARPLPSSSVAAAQPVHVVQASRSTATDPELAAQKAKDAYLGDRVAALCGYPARFCHGMVNLRIGLGMSETAIASLFQTVASEATTDSETDVSGATTVADVARWIVQPPSAWAPKTSMSRIASHSAQGQSVGLVHDPMARRRADPFVVTGVSLGLPGGEQVFNEDTFERLVRGETCISEVTDEYKQRLLDKNIVRLIKGRDGSVNMDQATTFGDIPQLAGVKGAFDLAEEFGIDPKVILAWDITTQLGMAAGLLALRDAAIPLTPVEQIGKGGLRLIRNWQVPQHTRDRTGIVFASCFPGFQKALMHAKTNGDDGEGRFDRRYLFQTLAMGHSQFAQYSGIRGPNTIINLACASATAAFGVAEDWLNADRVDRVVIISADDVTGDDLWEWIGGGFAASGAAATNNVVEETALPFDRRRNGLILGMGAAAFVVERNSEAEERGVQPIAELLGATTANSAFHGTRLDVDHVAETVDNFMTQMEQRWKIDRHDIAADTVFFSHETYTPARGGSAQSEVRALRDTFTHSTDKLVIANTKGFTGHPMAVGIEDASMFHGMKTGRIPPIANHKETDPELGDLNLSKGGEYPNLKYGLRFAAGFGSQMALSLVRRWPVKGERIDGAKFLAWNRNLAGTDDVVMRLLDQKLVAYVDGDNNLHGGVQGEPWPITAAFEGKPSVVAAPVVAPTPAAPAALKPPAAPAPAPTPVSVPASSGGSDAHLVETVIEVVVKHTGYPADFVELDQDLEGELGIDTVKQAEIMADIREKFSLPVDEEFILSDYPTLNHMIAYIQRMTGGDVAVAAPAVPAAPVPTVPVPAAPAPVAVSKPTTAPVTGTVDDASLNATVVEVVVKHTGYPADFIELDQDLEGELGIDTVKQAEIMADIRELFSLPLDEDFILSDYPTLNHMIGYIQWMQGGASPAPVAPSTPIPVPVPVPVPDSQTEAPETSAAPAPMASNSDVDSQLVEIVVKHTGYPADFIEMDQDLEGELGIDTVKQAEIMGDVRDAFSLPLDEDFVLSDHPTLNHFTAYILRMKGDVETPEPSTPAAATPPLASPTTTLSTPTRRWQIEVEAAEGIGAPLSLEGTAVVTDDGWGIAEAFCQRLEADGMSAIRVGFESNIRDMSIQHEGKRTVYRADPGNPEHVAAVCEALAEHNVTALLHMAPLKLASASWSEDATPS
ncbi:MAG: hypothetical protein HOM38_05960, partial [Euryarchaeota archaeon]|nr:hypothetical protein [Euryarchaeota archaeon]